MTEQVLAAVICAGGPIVVVGAAAILRWLCGPPDDLMDYL